MFLAVLFANTPLSYLIEQIFLFPPLFVGYFLSLRPSSALRQRLKPVKSVQAGKESVKTNSKVTRQKFETCCLRASTTIHGMIKVLPSSRCIGETAE
jgi:hypothetical protein